MPNLHLWQTFLIQILGTGTCTTPTCVQAHKDLPDAVICQLGTTSFRHNGNADKAAFSHDGKLLASSGEDNVIRVWETATGKLLWKTSLKPIDRRSTAVSDLAFSPTKKWLAIAGNGTHVWDLQSRKKVFTLPGQGGPKPQVERITFDPKGEILAWIDERGGVEVWSLVKKQKLFSRPGQVLPPNGTAIAFTSNNQFLAFPDKNRTVALIDRKTWKRTGALTRTRAEIAAIHPGPGENQLTTLNRLKELQVWDSKAQQQIGKLQAKGLVVAFHPIAPVVAIKEGDNSIVIRSRNNGKELHRIPCQFKGIGSLQWSAGGKVLAAAGITETVRLWKTSTWKEITPKGPTSHPISLTIHPNNSLSSLSHDGTYHQWDLPSGKLLVQFTISSQLPGEAIELGNCVYYANYYGGSFYYRNLSRPPLHLVKKGRDPGDPLSAPVSCPIAHPPTNRLAYAKGQKLFLSTATKNGRLTEVGTIDLPEWLHSAAWSPCGQWIAAGGWDRILLIDLSTRLIRYTLSRKNKEWEEPIQCIAFSQDQKMFAVAAGKKCIIYETLTGAIVRTITASDAVTTVRFVGRNGTFICGTESGRLILNHPHRENPLSQVESHRGAITCLLSTQKRQWLATGHRSTTILLWDLKKLKGYPYVPEQRTLSPTTCARLWDQLHKSNGTLAFEAIWKLSASEKTALPILEKKLRPVPPIDQELVSGCLVNLSSKSFATRDRASRQLERIGEKLISALNRHLSEAKGLEEKSRIKKLIKNAQHPSPGERQAHRAIQVLEHIGTERAKKLLQRIASGCPESRITKAAKASHGRVISKNP